MTLHLTYCTTCTRDMPAFVDALQELQSRYPDDLCIVDTACMAACDQPTSVMLDTDFYPCITMAELEAQIDELLCLCQN